MCSHSPFLGVLFLLRGVARANHSPGFRGVSSRASFTLLIVVIPVQGDDDQEVAVRAFPVRLPSGARYWTVLDENLAVVPVADAFLRHVRFGRHGDTRTRSRCSCAGATGPAGRGARGPVISDR